ncbi:MAG: META domain-containing protein, partial [Bacteroidota bacterium]
MHLRLLLVSAGLFLALACQPKPKANVPEEKQDMAKSELPIPSAWVITSCEQKGKTVPAVNDKGFIAIRDGQIGGHSGCNSFGGEWSGNSKKMKVPGVMATK